MFGVQVLEIECEIQSKHKICSSFISCLITLMYRFLQFFIAYINFLSMPSSTKKKDVRHITLIGGLTQK